MFLYFWSMLKCVSFETVIQKHTPFVKKKKMYFLIEKLFVAQLCN